MSTAHGSASAQYKENQSTDRQSNTNLLLIELTNFCAEVKQLAFHGFFLKVKLMAYQAAEINLTKILAMTTTAGGASAQHEENQGADSQGSSYMIGIELAGF